MGVQKSLCVAVLCILALCLPQGGCVRNPVTGGRQLALVSESQEIAMGEASHPEVLAQFGMVQDTALQEYFSKTGTELAKVSHRPDLPWHFTIVDSPVVNAFAVPGGYIYLTRGIIEYMNNEAELAGVIGHEIGHITARHSVTQLSQQQLLGLGLGLGSILSPTFSQFSQLAEAGLSILLLKFSREDERQADELGIEYMTKLGYDPDQMSKFFQVFLTMDEGSGQAVPSWLSSHPTTPDRIKATSESAARVKQASTLRDFKTNANEFMPRLEGLVYGENPREGFVENGRFIHPDLRFQIDIPKGWKTENTQSVVIFSEPSGGAVVQLSMAPAELGQSPEAVGQNIGRLEGTQLLASRTERIHGNQAFLGQYSVQSDSGTIGVLAAFISYGGHIYQLAGLAPSATFSNYASSINPVLRSFRELTDQKLLGRQPDRIKVYRARRGETLRSLANSMGQGLVKVEDLAQINRVDADKPLDAGTLVKLVQPGNR
jgi:predicted Zn-dependent protease